MAVTLTAEEASRIISLKYPDLSDGLDYQLWRGPRPHQYQRPQQHIPPRAGKKRSLDSQQPVHCQRHRSGKREHEDDHDGRYRAEKFRSPQRCSHKELMYPSMCTVEDHFRYLDQDSFVLSLTPLRGEKYSYMMEEPGSTPSVRKHKRPRLRAETANVSCQFGGGTGGSGIKRT